MTPAQLLSALAAVRHYASHTWACAQDTKWFRHECSCGLDDTLRGIDAMLAGRDVGQPESPTLKEIREGWDTGLDWPEDSALENGNYTSACVTCGLAFTGHKRRVVCKVCATGKERPGNHSEAPKSSKESDDGN